MSNSIERGVVSPVATSAIWNPDATVGFTALVGVRVEGHDTAVADDDSAPLTGIEQLKSVAMAKYESGCISKGEDRHNVNIKKKRLDIRS